MRNSEQGQLGEAIARSWLESQGYCLIDSNYVRRIGELDLIMREPATDVIVFVEVRYRASRQFGGALASIDYRKKKKLVRTATAWLQKHADARTHGRIDVIGVTPWTPSTTCNALIWQGHELAWVENAIEG